MFKKFILFRPLILVIITLIVSGCANSSTLNCDNNNVYENLECVKQKKDTLENQLKVKDNQKSYDYRVWLIKVKNKCEGKINYSLGEGSGLINEQCYVDEYLSRLEYLKTGKLTELVNSDGLKVTLLPYSSDDHKKCILKKEKNSCSKIKLISSSELLKHFPSISPSYGPSVILPETQDGKQIILSPFEDNEDEGPQLSITIVNSLGIVTEKTISTSKNVFIDNNYILKYYENGKEIKVQL